MSKKYWLGGSGAGQVMGDFNTAANWSDGAVPQAGDELVFDGRANIVGAAPPSYQTEGNHYSVTDGFEDIIVNLVSIIVTPDFTGNIGHGLGDAYGNYGTNDYTALRCGCDKMLIRGQGQYHFIADGAAFDLVICDTVTGALYLGSDGQEITKLINIAGNAEILAANDGTMAALDFGDPDIEEILSVTSAAKAIVNAGNTGTLEIECNAGNIYLQCNFTSAQINGGKVYWGDADLSGLFPTLSLTGKTYDHTGGTVERMVSAANNDFDDIVVGDAVYLDGAGGAGNVTDGFYIIENIDATNYAYIGLEADAGLDGDDTVAVRDKRSVGGATIVRGGSLDWRIAGILKGLKIRGAGTAKAIGEGDKLLGDSSVNSGTIEVFGGTLDLAIEQNGKMELDTDCEVLVRGSDASYSPPREENNTW